MEKIDIEKIVSLIKGTVIQQGSNEYIDNVCIDSRVVESNALFLPLVGGKTNGHSYIGQAVENGAAAVIIEEDCGNIPDNVWVIKVDSTDRVLNELACFYRSIFDVSIVAVTGSSGKTTTKDVIASVLSQKYKTLKTKGNQNNEIGVPLTLFRLNHEHETAVIEMGMDHLGDIHKMIGMVKPRYRVITNIGSAHLESLGSKENILKAKCEIFEMMQNNDIAVLNGDDPYLNTVDLGPYKTIRVGINNDHLDYRATDVQKSSNSISFSVNDERYFFHIPGTHNVYNALVGIAIGKEMGLSYEEIQKGLDEFTPSGNRMSEERIDGTLYIDDSYNANPDAVKAALEVLDSKKNTEGRRIAVLGDMLELGPMSHDLHLEIGTLIPDHVDQLIAVGQEAEAYVEGAVGKMSSENIALCDDWSAALKVLLEWVRPKDVVLIKASHGMHLDNIMNYFKEKKDGNK